MTKIVRFDPFAELYALQKQLLGDDWATSTKGLTLPTTDVYMHDDKELVVEAHLPNFEQDNIDIHVENGVLVVQAEKTETEEDGKGKKKYFVRESSNSFYRTIRLPKDADAENIEAHFEDGVLKVVVPIKEAPKPKKINVKQKSSKAKTTPKK